MKKKIKKINKIFGGKNLSKLLWNPNQDAMALRREFMELYYGIAAEEINEFTVNYEEWIGNVVQNVDKQYFNDATDPKDVPLAFLDGQLKILDRALSKVEASEELAAEEKAGLYDRVLMAKTYPLYMKLINRGTFYSGDIEKQNAATREFFDLCDYFGVLYYAEHHPISELKAQYPYL
ncbi:MAG: hypothetical protein IJX81_05470 [Clostridia bacterium]|nr:hypothetical protein [Clostridia bacterium]